MIDRAEQIRQESERLGVVLAGCDPTSGVPSCPGWTASDLLSHFVTVQQFWAATIGGRLTADGVEDYERSRPPLPQDRAALLALRREATNDLLDTLGRRDPSEAAWSWFGPDHLSTSAGGCRPTRRRCTGWTPSWPPELRSQRSRRPSPRTGSPTSST